MVFSEDIIKRIWEKGKVVDGYDSELFRQDACGAWIRWDLYGINNLYGWEIDHIYPISLGGGNEIDNLRPMQHQNNASKGNDYPSYMAVVISEGSKNIEKDKMYIVNRKIQEQLANIYNENS